MRYGSRPCGRRRRRICQSGWLGHSIARWAQSRSGPWQKLGANAHAYILAKTGPNIALEPTANSLRSYVAAAIGGGSPRALDLYEEHLCYPMISFGLLVSESPLRFQSKSDALQRTSKLSSARTLHGDCLSRGRLSSR